jgi:hypothetical protein
MYKNPKLIVWRVLKKFLVSSLKSANFVDYIRIMDRIIREAIKGMVQQIMK